MAVSTSKPALLPDCDDFYLHFSSTDASKTNPADFTVSLPAVRNLTGKWKMALKEITYTKWTKEKVYSDAMEFILMANENETQRFKDYLQYVFENGIAHPISDFSRSKIPGVPNVAIISFYKVRGDPSKGVVTDPAGNYQNAEEFVSAVNAILQDMHMEEIFHAPPYFYLKDKGTAFKTVFSNWNYPKNHWRKLCLFPIIGHRNRRLLGLPKNYVDKEMQRLIMKTWIIKDNRYDDTELGEEGFTQGTDNIFVLCNLIRTTGVKPDINGSILRALPAKHVADGTVVFYDFSEDYYEVTPKTTFFTVTLKLVSSRDYRVLNLAHPTSFTLHFKPINNCQPEIKRVLV